VHSIQKALPSYIKRDATILVRKRNQRKILEIKLAEPRGMLCTTLKRWRKRRIEKKKDYGMLYHNVGISLLYLKKNKEACEQFKLALQYKFTQSQSLLDKNCK